MAVTTYSRLADQQQVAATAAAVITNAASHNTVVQHISLHNSDDTLPYTVTLYRVPDNAGSVGTAAAANRVLGPLTLQPRETFNLAVLWVLKDTNDTIQAVASTAAKINFSADGQDVDNSS